MADQAVLAEIARLEGELTRIRLELEGLKRKVEGPVRRHTKAFTSAPPALEPPALESRDAPPSSIPAPSPSVPASSQTVPTSRRRSQAAHVGLSDFPPPPATQPNATPSRRQALGNPEAGRYSEYVGDGRPTRKSR